MTIEQGGSYNTQNNMMKLNEKWGIAFFWVIFVCTGYSQNVSRQLMNDFPEWIFEKFDNYNPEAKILGDGLFTHLPPIPEPYSETNNQFAGTHEGKLYIRNKASDSLTILLNPDPNIYWSMDNAMWSPDGRYIAAKQVEDYNVPEIDLRKKDSKEIIKKKYSRAGEPIPKHIFYIVAVTSGEKREIKFDEKFPYIHLLQWSANSQKLYFLIANRLLKEVQLIAVDVNTGTKTTLLKETSKSYLIGLNLLQGYSNRLINSKHVVFFEERYQFTWMSEKTGYNQIYLYDALGNLKRPLTNFAENGVVVSIDAIDKENGWIYFKARGNKDDPYQLQIYRTSLNKPIVEKITTSPGMLDVFFRKSMDTLWVFRSELPKTLQLERYTSQGAYIDSPWQANDSIFSQNPINFEYEWVLAADGVTKLQTFILKPVDFDPSKKYPVVEHIYGGSFINVVVRDVLDMSLWEMNKLAQEGFIVVYIDGRGTSERGKEFQDFSYGKLGQVELEDHVEALTQLAQKRPYMDLNRVGIYGHSWGGHFALRALVEFPELYKAGHINAAALDPENFRIAVEPFMGCLPQECPESYKKAAISNKLGRLKAPLMIVHGTNDDDVPIADAYQLVTHLKALRYTNYEFVVDEGADHIVMKNRNWLPQMINFFKTKLK